MNSGVVRWPIPFLLSFLSLACALTALADTIHLKSGRVIKGHVERFGNGEFVIRLLPTDDGTQPAERMILLVDSVESVEFDADSSPPASAPTEKLIALDANQDVVATGVQVSRGQRVRITATGQMQFADGRTSAPGGLDAREAGPFPGERYGVLIAMVGGPQSAIYHIIGEEGEFEARLDGEVFLQVNAPSLQGARGNYTARIQAAAGSSSSPAPAPQEPLPGGSRELQQERTVPADNDWVDTGIDLLVGDTLRIRAEGTILYTSSNTCGPNGGERTWGDLIRALPVNDVGRGALIGLIGQTGVATPFFIGAQAEFTVEKTGRLLLGINDDNYGNNSGSFRVQIEIVPGRR
jgi:hypothetical protein